MLLLLELYCGGGNHTVALAPFVSHIVAIEVSSALCIAAEDNLSSNGITNVTIVHSHSDKFARTILKSKTFVDPKSEKTFVFNCVLVDPPRSGLDPLTLSMISSFEHILYISCCPNSLVRDLIALRKCAAFEVVSLAFMDQFPYSPHLETGVYLSKLKS